MPVHVLLFDAGSDQEGIHSLELNGRTVVLLFEMRDDAERYAGLLEAQDFPTPTVEALDREEMEAFCRDAGYEARFVPSDFLPQTAEERLLLAPPVNNLDVSSWQEDADASDADRSALTDARDAAMDAARHGAGEEAISSADPDLEAFRRQLEGLL